MEDWIIKKDRIVEKLMYFSARMAEEAINGRLPQFNQFVEERSKLFDELAECDRHLVGKLTPKNLIWFKELENLKRVDSEIAEHLRHHQKHIQIELESLGQAKMNLLQSENINSKGHGLRTHG
ncbi:MAG: hypothetical protein J0L93_10860 [Deltaproteobacteria bacterium]|nr:hypothetical protein [Deltaproteobacteria bacterium]